MVKRFLKRWDEHDVAVLAVNASLQARIISGLYMVKYLGAQLEQGQAWAVLTSVLKVRSTTLGRQL